jgi:hypothetical protein
MGETIAVSNFMIYTLGLVVFFAYLWGGFVFYKKAIDSHIEDTLALDVIVLSAFWSFILGRVSFVLTNLDSFYGHWSRIFLLVNYPGIERWGALLGIILAVFYIVKKKKGKFFDFFDLVTLGVLSGSAFYWVGINFINFYWQNLVVAVINFLGFVWFWNLEKTYRHISWYRGSKTFAKSGFVSGFGLVFLGFSFVLENILFRNFNIFNVILMLVLFIGGMVLVYIRSGRLLADDLKSINIWNKRIKK